MKMLLLTAAAILAVLALIVALQPSGFRVTRTARISAPAAAVFDQVNNLHRWEAWSPWEKLDPAMKKSFEGPSAGTGAVSRWAGNSQVGEGSNTITESRPHERIRFKLEMLKPFKCANDVEFTFQPEGGQTVVTWSMAGKLGFMAKAAHLVMNMDKMVGGQFEQGLAQLKAVVESQSTRQDRTDTTTTGAEKRDLVITRRFDAPPELVWKSWSDPRRVMQWWGPDGFTSPSARMDFREGGTSLVCMRAPKEFGGRDMYSTWTYQKIVPRQRIEYVHNLADQDGRKIDPGVLGMPPDFPQDQRHVITFKDLGDGRTELTVTEYAWPVGQMMTMSQLGMEQCLDKMAASLAAD